MIHSTYPSSLFFPINKPRSQSLTFNSYYYANDANNNSISHKIQGGFRLLCQTRKENKSKEPLILQSSGFCSCGRKHFLKTMSSTLLFSGSLPSFAMESDSLPNSSSSMETLNKFHAPRPDWYEELFASVLNYGTKSYEAEIASYKSQLFAELRGQAKEVLEIGIGTGPNLKYYASDSDMHVFGVDPNKKMEKYARGAAEAAGLSPGNFKFVHAVGEALPLSDASVDAVIGTLVMCSVKDVNRTLEEIKRVLKPGGLYLFIEHVAAKEGTFRRFLQNILNPLQQLLGDGCHLTKETESYIANAGFSGVNSSTTVISNAFFVNPHVYGIARK